jgi:hypothetical protein
VASVLVSILPIIIGTAVVPVLLIIVLLLLAAENGTAKAAMFVLGAFVMRLIHGLVFGFLLRPDADAPADEDPGVVLATLLLVLGTLMLVSALKSLLTDVDPDAAPPKWMAMLDGTSPGRAFLMGLGMTAIAVKMWLFSMAVVGEITSAGLGTAAAVLVFVIYDLLAVSPAATVVLLSVVAPAWADRNLDRLSAWMAAHNRAITIAVSLVFGLLFFYKGYMGLWG